MIQISEWLGRLGNNVHQLITGYLLADHYGCDLLYPSHNSIAQNKSQSKSSHIIKSNLFYRKDFPELSSTTEQDIRDICLTKIEPILNIKNYEVPEDIITIHIRNGDIFTKQGAHQNYIQPPLQYYKHILNYENVKNYDNVWVLSQDIKPHSPAVEGLKDMGCRILKLDTKDSIALLSNSQKLICSLSSFSRHFFYTSKNAQKLYVPDYSYKEGPALYASVYGSGLRDIGLYKASLPNYIRWGDWSASSDQLKLMVSYDEQIDIIKIN